MTNQVQTFAAPGQIRALAESLTAVSQVYGKAYDDRTVKIWLEALQAYSPDEILAAFKNHLKTHRDPPVIASVIEEIKLLQFGGCSGAFGAVTRGARSYGWGACAEFTVFETPAIHFAIEALGGWGVLLKRVAAVSDAPFLQRDFTQAFRDYRCGVGYIAGFGPFSGTNVRFIGDVGRAREVYRCSEKRRDGSIDGKPQPFVSKPRDPVEVPFPEELAEDCTTFKGVFDHSRSGAPRMAAPDIESLFSNLHLENHRLLRATYAPAPLQGGCTPPWHL